MVVGTGVDLHQPKPVNAEVAHTRSSAPDVVEPNQQLQNPPHVGTGNAAAQIQQQTVMEEAAEIKRG